MNSKKMVCRVCGKEYEPCRSTSKNPNIFHWQEVACSPECGAVYLQRIQESRSPAFHKRNRLQTKVEAVVPHEEQPVEVAE